ncbi:protein transport protein SEC16B homolog isoform X2 [Durio zibethinus]|uniref:Protein transport protein sec16 n=1 Tax=Durio zibethinus TaxID=66656 RepID=A0A6P5YEY4_DURZI|nr:protein transport protein SEC16B homolog isoform X2 [Durio zibethinus]
MASNPPFQVEDQTDEDFFDKLVNDDDDVNTGPTASKFTEGNDSDDARAFANLTIGEDSGGEADNYDEKEKDPVHAGPATANAHAGDDGNDSLGLDNNVTDSNNHGEEGAWSEVGFDQNLSENAGSMNSGVKEVGWNSFYADSKNNGAYGFGSYADFFNDLGEKSAEDFPGKVDEIAKKGVLDQNSVSSYGQYLDSGHVYGTSSADNGNEQDMTSSQYWENMYPGWKYDANSEQWYQVNGYEGNLQGSAGGDGSGTTDLKVGASYLQQTVQSVPGTMTTVESGATKSVTSWNQVSQVNNGYPEHMVFDPQYPGWYYDTIAQEWRELESYNASVQSMVQGHDQQNQNGFASTGGNSQSNSTYGEYEQGDNYGSGLGSPGEHGNWSNSYGNYNSPGLNMWQPGTVAKTESFSSIGGNEQSDTSFGSNMPVNNHVHTEANGVIGLRSFVPSENFNRQFNQTNLKQNEQMHFSNDFYGGQKSVSVAQQPLQSSQQFPYASNTGRSSAGRPPHALVSFGFGGKLIVMKDGSPLQNSPFGTQDSVGASICVLNLLEVVNGNTNDSGAAPAACNYFRTLCQQSVPGPLVGGNVGSKDLNKWIDERIASCESPDTDYRNGEILRLLLSLLKIACQRYGKLRSPFGADTLLKETDTPESAVAKLFASAKRKDTPYGASSHCLQQLPSEGQIRATAFEVQNLLVSGRKKEALQCAQEGQLWGPALVLASQLGDQFYADTVKQMALHQLVAGSSLRTLCLLIAGQPAEVFSKGTTVDSMDMSRQHVQLGDNCMLDDWEQNLAVITANRTKDDELVIIHLGDCLWKERSEIIAAHICYLVAEANFESYSDSARLCLIGADHWKFPRTYASPEAIQRTEFYEYSKVLGNSQYILLPFQPYKLIYAHMLAEVGKVSDSLKYCQAVLKSLKTGRAPEIETWKQLVLSLEDRIRIHQQGGYAANLVPAKLVGKLLNFFDSTAHRVVGGLPPPAPSVPNENSQGNDHFNQQTGPRVSASQSTMAMSSLMSSASMEPISDWASRVADGKMAMHNRSVSEPDFGRTPRQHRVDSSKEAGASTAQGKASGSVGASRFSRFGFGSQLLQKTVGLVLRPRSDKQAKLGEKNKFYYDEKLKRWVEEGAEPPAEEAALPPPPTTAGFQNGMSDYNLNSALKSEGSPPNGSPTFRNPTPIEHASGIPPIPTSSNQFSARGRMGVRARYVDTFNQGGGGQANLFQSPAVPSVKPAVAANAKFFIPTAASTTEQTMEAIAENAQEENTTSNNPTTSNANESYQSPAPSSSMTMQRFPSMDNITRKGIMTNANGFPPHSRRAASWSGSNFSNALSPPSEAEISSFGEALGMPPSLFMPGSMNGSFGDELHEVDL